MDNSSQNPGTGANQSDASLPQPLRFPEFESCDGVPKETYDRLHQLWMKSSLFLSHEERITFLQLVPRAKLGKSTRNIVNQCIAQELKAHPQRVNRAYVLVLKDIFGAKALLGRDWWSRFRQTHPDEAAATEAEGAKESHIRPPEEIPCAAPPATRRAIKPSPVNKKRKAAEETADIPPPKAMKNDLAKETPKTAPMATNAAKSRRSPPKPPAARVPVARGLTKVRRWSSMGRDSPSTNSRFSSKSSTHIRPQPRVRTEAPVEPPQTTRESLRGENERLRADNERHQNEIRRLRIIIDGMAREKAEIRDAVKKLSEMLG